MTLFVDTSAWVAIKDRREKHHAAASAYLGEVARRRERLVTTDFVLDETYTLLLYDVGYEVTVQFKREIDLLSGAQALAIVHVGPAVQAEAWAVFERFNRDKAWSFTDCTSYVVMRTHQISECFGFDEDFAQMGFTVSPAKR
jgi:predicted nucleic acid-binding protein